LWEAEGGATAREAERRAAEIERKIANIRQAVEDGIDDAGWANGRLAELREERAKFERQARALRAEPPTIDAGPLQSYAARLPRLLAVATADEKRRLVSCPGDKLT
jgi:hypothetical protein